MSSLGNHAANFKMPILQHTFKGERWWKLHEQLPLIHYFSLSWKNRHCQRAEFKLFFMAGMGYRMMPRLDDAKAEALATFRFLYHLTIMKFEGVINLKVEQYNS